jgi:hypothetical protein
MMAGFLSLGFDDFDSLVQQLSHQAVGGCVFVSAQDVFGFAGGFIRAIGDKQHVIGAGGGAQRQACPSAKRRL